MSVIAASVCTCNTSSVFFFPTTGSHDQFAFGQSAKCFIPPSSYECGRDFRGTFRLFICNWTFVQILKILFLIKLNKNPTKKSFCAVEKKKHSCLPRILWMSHRCSDTVQGNTRLTIPLLSRHIFFTFSNQVWVFVSLCGSAGTSLARFPPCSALAAIFVMGHRRCVSVGKKSSVQCQKDGAVWLRRTAAPPTSHSRQHKVLHSQKNIPAKRSLCFVLVEISQ